jgi:hypothetical protein
LALLAINGGKVLPDGYTLKVALRDNVRTRLDKQDFNLKLFLKRKEIEIKSPLTFEQSHPKSSFPQGSRLLLSKPPYPDPSDSQSQTSEPYPQARQRLAYS